MRPPRAHARTYAGVHARTYARTHTGRPPPRRTAAAGTTARRCCGHHGVPLLWRGRASSEGFGRDDAG
ncbi:hypothetical protein ACFC09_05290 [Streptomyces sp. NPDC056161]|uniref:hypothetical protein n=1 Tax=Streptomyces sp. NPDC056161 TaxID=3345732 RepID=UPI0035DCB21B